MCKNRFWQRNGSFVLSKESKDLSSQIDGSDLDAIRERSVSYTAQLWRFKRAGSDRITV